MFATVSPAPRLVWSHTALPNVECRVHVRFYSNGINNCTHDSPPRVVDQLYTGAASTTTTDGFVDVPLNCYGFTDKGSGTTYTIFANCNTVGTPDNCF